MNAYIKCILDTNILIKSEETDANGQYQEKFIELSHLCNKYGIKRYYHEASLQDLEKDNNLERRKKTFNWLPKYPKLENSVVNIEQKN